MGQMGQVAIAMLTGGTLTLVGYVLGRRSRPKRAPEPVKPVCGCTHSRGTHEGGTGKCNAAVRVVMNGDASMTDCACVLYDGPNPVQPFYAPEILP